MAVWRWLSRRRFSLSRKGKDGRNKVAEIKDEKVKKKKRPDFTGSWRQVQNENADKYLQAMGYNGLARKLTIPLMKKSEEEISHAGESVRIKTTNLKGEWDRSYVTDGSMTQCRTADGQKVDATSWWDFREEDGTHVHKSRLEGAKQGTFETWRWMDEGEDKMYIKSILISPEQEEEWMLWHYKRDSMGEPNIAVGDSASDIELPPTTPSALPIPRPSSSSENTRRRLSNNNVISMAVAQRHSVARTRMVQPISRRDLRGFKYLRTV